MSGNRKPVAAHRRIVIKIGSALLVDRASRPESAPGSNRSAPTLPS
jgi:glutamate 5-kinase